MVVFKLFTPVAILAFVALPFSINAIEWLGNWAFACDFKENDFAQVLIPSNQCSRKCTSTPQCTHFAWTTLNGGTCWMKHGHMTKNNAFDTTDRFMICGVIERGVTVQINWNGNDWAYGCGFQNNDIHNVQSPAEQCSVKCLATPGCSHFTWTIFNGGTCWMKRGRVTKNDAFATLDNLVLCGVVDQQGLAVQINWNGHDWAYGCAFQNSDLKNAQVPAEQCDGKCMATPGCTHFTWTTFNGGTCWMKRGRVTKNHAFATLDNSVLCGVVHQQVQINWKGNNWAYGCDFHNNDIRNTKIPTEQCSKKCIATRGCTHYTWNGFDGGTCWMKRGGVTKDDAFATLDNTMICGIIPQELLNEQLAKFRNDHLKNETNETTAISSSNNDDDILINISQNPSIEDIKKLGHEELVTLVHHRGQKATDTSNNNGHQWIPSTILVLIIAILLYFLIKCCYKKRHTKFRDRLNSSTKKKKDGTCDVLLIVNNNNWEIARSNLHIYKSCKLGSGEFGTVYKGQLLNHQKFPNREKYVVMPGTLEQQIVAVKTLPDTASIVAKQYFLDEIDIMKKIGCHEYLVNLLGCITVAEPLCLVSEYCETGDLHHYLRDRRDFMVNMQSSGCSNHENFVSIEVLYRFAWQISCGMEYLAEHNFVHRDLACRNVLLDKFINAKIGDFGLCRNVESQNELYYRTNGGRLPIKWMAIESILQYKFTSSSDMWSFGIVLFELFTFARSPYPGVDPNSMGSYLKEGKRMCKPESCPAEIYKLMQMTWQEDPTMRPTFTEIKHQMKKLIQDLKDCDYSYVTLLNADGYYNLVDT